MLQTQERDEDVRQIATVIDPEALVDSVQENVGSSAHALSDRIIQEVCNSISTPAPKFKLAQTSNSPAVAAETVRRLLSLDGKPELNLASFVSTYVDKEGLELCKENITKNLADGDEYPALMTIQKRCVSILSHLWNTQDGETGVGTATTGSSEAIHLGGLAMKRRWEARQRANGRPTDKPNIIMGANAQVALEKFARYFDVENRFLDVHAGSDFGFDNEDLKKNVDENTIGVFVIMGSTYTGHYQNVKAVAKALDEVEKEKGWDIPIHVDGASGAFVAPFVTPELEWDFRVPRVKSINTSGHKFGLTPAGCGWIIWRDRKFLPDELLFTLNYLGGSEETYTLNFSRPGHPIIYQYYEMIKNGHAGYKALHSMALKNARILSIFLERTGYFDVLSDIHRPAGKKFVDKFPPPSSFNPKLPESYYNPGLPVVSFGFSDDFRKQHPGLPQESISALMRSRGYIIPNYPMPAAEEKHEVLRVVVNAYLTVDFVDKLMEDLIKAVNRLLQMEKSLGGRATSDVVYTALAAVSATDHDETDHETSWKERTGHKKHHHSRC
ncbi:Glutamate decarboxylase [Wickerhamiella sorbophila]|uniref:Glutamate decarboxylase n=1 Tax=Wickerhamiella sorbophila TaxID=45607 RepID=A0A2T0FL96_9ASCO|nr:Glutamate decarboxylase [Wickerhamiella sorbophila]PRT55761.1 Glutamate decarboxylase [Wickerhamiella sorbophila]